MSQDTCVDSHPHTTVKKRKVLYLCGYDPRGSGYYHTLYRDEATKNTQADGEQLSISERKRNGRFSARWSIDSNTTHTDYEFLSWDDIIRQFWLRTPWSLLFNSFRVYSVYIASGTAARIRRTAKIHFIIFIYPLLFILGMLLVSTAVAEGVAVLAAKLLPGFYLKWLAGATAAVATYVYLGNRLERKFNFYWVLRVYYYSMRLAQDKVDGLDARLDAYARHLLDVLADDQYDEVLFVGHSAGAILLPLVVSRALSIDGNLRGGRDRLNLLTLGHCIHDVSLHPGGAPLRSALRRCAASGIYWLDVTVPADGACYPLVDVAFGSGLEPHEDAGTRVSISARFHTLLTPEHYKALKGDRLKLHFQYLMAADHPGEYNYFDITAGQMSLRERFKRHST